MRKWLENNTIKARLIAIVVLAFVIFLLGLPEAHPQFIERHYSEGIYEWICRLLHPVFNLFPFSVGDIFYLLVIGYFIYAAMQIVRRLIRKQFVGAIGLVLKCVMIVQGLMIAFYLLWGINYFRPSASVRLNLPDSSYTPAELQAVTSILIDSANATRARVTAADLQRSNSSICDTAVEAIKALSLTSPNFKAYHPKIKLSLFTPILNYIGTSGYYNPYTTEAQMNYQMPVFIRPFVACHEMSHQIGYGAEDEANFVGYLAGIQSHDRLLRYSAYHEAVAECMRDLYFRDSLLNKQMKLCVSPQVHNDFVAERRYWLKYAGEINVVTGIFYDNFLKANNQPQGLETYNRMVRLIMAMYRKQQNGTKTVQVQYKGK